MSATPFLGLLMLETRFPRPHGDVGHPATFAFPVRRRVVADASPRRIVHEAAAGLIGQFVDAAQALVDSGACAIGTSCGFLGLHQRALADAVAVPVATTSLLQCAWLAPLLSHRLRPGIVTIDAAALTVAHLGAANVPAGTPVSGVDPAGEFASRLLNDEPTLDTRRAEREVVDAARDLTQTHPDVGAIVLECTNMPPYAGAVARATGRPVYDVVTLLHWVWSGVARRAPQSAEG